MIIRPSGDNRVDGGHGFVMVAAVCVEIVRWRKNESQ